MLRSKEEVDKYVSSILCSLRDERERLNKYYQISRFYVEIKEYDLAKRYLEGYLSHRNDFAPAFKLMGQILESQDCLEKAVASYKRSLELDDKQKNVLIKICELYCQLDVDPERAKYWADCVEKTCPNHAVVFKLREKAIANHRGDSLEGREELELLLTSELVKNPKDVGVRIKLLRLYMNSGRVNEAYEHALDVERTVAFTQSLAWYQCFLDVLQVYKREHEHTVNGVYHQMLIHVLNSLATLTIEQKPLAECMEVLFRLDQTLYDVDNQAIQGDQWTVLLREMQAQLFFHAGTYLLKKARQGKMSWRDATDYASACYLCSATYKPPLRHSPWYAMAREEDRKLLDYWWQAAHYRCSQIGHMINQLSGFGGNAWMERIDGEYCTDTGKQRIFEMVFTLPNMKDKKTSSYLIKNTTFTIIAHELPREDQLRNYDHVAYALKSDNLHSLVWTALQYHKTKNKTQPDYEMRIFDGLQHGVLNLDTGVLETLSQLDAEAFFLATVYVSGLKLEDLHNSVLLEPGQPCMLPAALMSSLVTAEQNEWWDMARKVATGTAKDQFSKMRLTLQRGLEVIRMVGNHGMTLDLVVHLARTFEVRAEVAKKNMNDVLDLANDIASLEERAKKYWKVTVEMAEKHMRGTSISRPKQPLFESKVAPLDEQTYLTILQEARFHTAMYTMESGKNEEAIEMLEKVHTAEASFHQGKLYTELSTQLLGSQMLDQTVGEDRVKHLGLLTKSRDKFYMTLDRLRGDRFHRLNADLANEIEDVECKLNLLDCDNAVPRTDTSLNSEEVDESVIPHASTMAQMRGLRGDTTARQPNSLFASTPRRTLDMSKAANSPGRNFSKPTVVSQMSSAVGHVTPPRLRPSPERLEAQMRQFTQTQDTVVMSLLEELKDRRREMQELQEKCVGLERDKNQIMERMFIAEKDKERATMQAERVPEQQQELDDRKRRLQRKEDEVEDMKQKLSEDRRDIQLEKDRQAAEGRRQEEDWKRVATDRERLNREWTEIDGKRKALDRERELSEDQKEKFENEKKQFESEKKQFESEKMKFESEKKKFESEKKKFEEEKATQRAAPPPSQASTTAAAIPPDPLFNLRQPFQHPPYDYLQSGFMHGHPFAGYPAAQGHQAFQGSAAPGFPGSLQQGFGYPGSTLPSHGAPRMGTGGTQQTTGTLQDADDVYYEDDDEESENNGLVPGQRNLVSQLASTYMYPQSIPPIFATTSHTTIPMPGPGFFASPDRSQTSQISHFGAIGTGVGSGSPQTVSVTTSLLAGKPSLAQAGTSLASLLSSSAIVSQVQGAALYSAHSSTSANTRFPMSMPSLANNNSVSAAQGVVSTPATTVTPQSQEKAKKQDTVVDQGKSAQDKPGKIATDKQEEAEDDQNESYNDPSHDPHFEPIVNLPEVEVKTGEEGEKILYECRGKLYRFIDKQWKERGLGQIKILEDEENNRVRIVMRREQVFKVCANHLITEDMEINEREDMKGNVLTWRAMDYSDDEGRLEQFCLRVKTPEIAQEFKENFQKACKMAKSVSTKTEETKSKSDEPTSTTSTEDAVVPQSNLPSLSELFKPEEGSWNCAGCMLINKADAILCPACETIQPGKEEEGAAEKQKKKSQIGNFSTSNNKFSGFGGSGTGIGGFQFGGNSGLGSGGLGSRTDSASSFSSMQSGSSFGFGQIGNGNVTTATASVAASGSLITSIPKPSGAVFGGFKLPDSTSATSVVETKSSTPLFGGFKSASIATTTLPSAATSTSTVTTTTSSGASHSFGGLTFLKKPEIQEKKEEQKPTSTSEQKASPFSSFSFGNTVSKGDTKADSTSEVAKTSIFGGNVKASEPLSFAGVSKGGDGQAFTKKADSKGFEGTGAPVFGGSPQKSAAESATTTSQGEGAEVEFEPDVDFKPLVHLEEVETKTGEEDEEVLFEERSKLYRFDLLTKQWKERGIGQIKILKHQEQLKFRVVMRREQVLKLCANHMLTKDMTITVFEGSEKMLRWMASDYAEEELKQEMFAAKFKTPELAQKFKTMFEECVERLKKEPVKKPETETKPVSSEEVSSTQDDSSSKGPLSELFKPKEGEWECDICLIRNKPDLKRCEACQTVKPGCEGEVTSTTASVGSSGFQMPTITAPPMSFGFKPTSSDTSAPTSSTKFSFGGAIKPDSSTTQQAPTFGSGFSFGGKPASKTTTPPKAQAPLFGAFQFGAASASPEKSPFSFTKAPEKEQVDDAKVSTSDTSVTAGTNEKAPTSNKFGLTNFSFSGLTPLKDSKPKSPLKSPVKSPGGEDEYYQDEGDGEHIQFEPIVTLPENYELVTGEEDEDTVYHRKAKLFRFTDGQWKERGVGEVKILKNKNSGKMRILMRRDQVHKVCLNHMLSPEMELLPMKDSKGRAFVWYAEDYSEEELVHEQFAIRFKTDVIASDFKECFDNAKEGKPVKMMEIEESHSPKKKSVETVEKTDLPSLSKADEAQKPASPKQEEPAKPTFLDAFSFKTDEAKVTSTTTEEKAAFGGGFNFGQKEFNFGQTKSTPTSTASTLFGGSQGTTPQQGFKFGANTTPVTTAEPSVGGVSGKAAQKSLLADLLASGDTSASDLAFNPSTAKQGDAENDVIFVSEKMPTPQQAARAKQFMLPKTFYFFEDSDFKGCRGCIGCDPDNFDMDSIGQQSQDDDDVIFLYEEKSSPSKQHLLSKYQLPDNFYSYEHKEGCSGCPGCENNEAEATVIEAALSFLSGGGSNLYQSAQNVQSTSMSPDDEIVHAAHAFVTGGRGNIDYVKELKPQIQKQGEETITSSNVPITGDKGNTSYLKDLLSSTDDKEVSQTTSTTKQEADSTTDVGTSKPVFGTFGASGGFDFASLAGKSDGSGFAFGKKQEGKPFEWQGAGQSVFIQSPSKEVEEGSAEDVEREPDVHFEPVVSLPEVEVTTGEEDEVVLYAQRAKLYRYDNKQWKERGLGEMKILKHKDTGKFRLLQRREQVLKICCNQPITMDTKLTRMQTSETTWCWFGMDSSDTEAKLEQFAIRFKTIDLAKEFYDKVESCKEDLSRQEDSAGAAEPTSETEGPKGEATTKDDKDDYGSDEEQSLLFNKRATMFYVNDDNSATNVGMGNFTVNVDEDILGLRIHMTTDANEMACNHIICRRHIAQKNEKKRFVEWTAKDFSTDEPIKRTLRVVFSSASAVKEFMDVFNQGLAMARESEIDEILDSTYITGELLLSSEK